MSAYRFTRDVNVDVLVDGDVVSRPYAAGDTIGERDILKGCFESMRRVGYLVPDEDEPEPVKLDEQPKKKK